MALAAQALIFLEMLGLGFALGLWGDMLRLVSRRRAKILVAALDILFWAAALCLVFIVLFNLNFLEIRLYAFASLALGVFFYFRYFSPLALRFFAWVYRVSLKAAAVLARVLAPLLLPLRYAAIILDRVSLFFIFLIAAALEKCREIKAPGQEIPPAA